MRGLASPAPFEGRQNMSTDTDVGQECSPYLLNYKPIPMGSRAGVSLVRTYHLVDLRAECLMQEIWTITHELGRDGQSSGSPTVWSPTTAFPFSSQGPQCKDSQGGHGPECLTSTLLAFIEECDWYPPTRSVECAKPTLTTFHLHYGPVRVGLQEQIDQAYNEGNNVRAEEILSAYKEGVHVSPSA